MQDKNISYSSAETQRDIRLEKVKRIRELGHYPYSVKSRRDYNLSEAKKLFQEKSYLVGNQDKEGTLVGRIKSKRVSGKIAFTTIEDESLPEGFQLIFRRDFLPAEDSVEQGLSFSSLKSLVDEGDYIQAEGYLDYSQRGEPSLFVRKLSILTKSLRILPEKMDYENFEERYTNRVVDFKMNTKDQNDLSVRDLVRLKHKYWSIWREELIKEGFLEVECPIFEHIPGGAEAKPFTTFYNELDQDVYLRISLELPLKKLIAGGFEKVFEIGRIFRNEGSSPQHLQEYTQIEWYWAYADYTDGMKLMKRVYQRIVEEILGQLTQIDYYGHEVDWGEWCTLREAKENGWGLVIGHDTVISAEEVKKQVDLDQDLKGWPVISYFDAIRHYSSGKVDLENKDLQELKEIAEKNNVELEVNADVPRVMDKIYKKTARINMHNPIFLALVPVELEPLAKRNPDQPHLTERWQIVAGTAELGKCFSELNDPVDQFGRFEDQQAARDAGDEEAQFMDNDYVKALELGTPPMAGFGASERILSFLLGKHIKECVTFPHVRSEDNSIGKSGVTMTAHAVILNTPERPFWSKLNTVAHLTASLGAREGKQLIHLDGSKTKEGEYLPMNIQHSIMNKQTDNRQKLWELKREAEKQGLQVTVFTQEMQDSSDDEKVKQAHESKQSDEVGLLGVLIYGKKKEVESLTENYKLVE